MNSCPACGPSRWGCRHTLLKQRTTPAQVVLLSALTALIVTLLVMRLVFHG